MHLKKKKWEMPRKPMHRIDGRVLGGGRMSIIMMIGQITEQLLGLEGPQGMIPPDFHCHIG